MITNGQVWCSPSSLSAEHLPASGPDGGGLDRAFSGLWAGVPIVVPRESSWDHLHPHRRPGHHPFNPSMIVGPCPFPFSFSFSFTFRSHWTVVDGRVWAWRELREWWGGSRDIGHAKIEGHDKNPGAGKGKSHSLREGEWPWQCSRVPPPALPEALISSSSSPSSE